MMTKKDWEKVVKDCSDTINQAENVIEININILEHANNKLDEFEEDVK